MVTIGEKVANFTVDAFVGGKIKKISLNECEGRWLVLLFYPADFTFVCPTELQEAAEFYEEFKSNNAEVMSVSTDTAYAHKAWHDTSEAIGKVQYPMLADPTGDLCRQFGTYIPKEGLSLRASFIIDPKGVLKAADMHDNSIGRNTAEILRKLQASIFVAKRPGLVCPASWHPGDKTLKSSVDLVGKI
ncbi:MAG: redoxin domain-containing protein [bacterium]|nr:redoxin domain-containing protein [bacterium]